MKISLHKLYHYLFGDWADIEKHLKPDLPPEIKADLIARRTNTIREFFAKSKTNLIDPICRQANVNLMNILYTPGSVKIDELSNKATPDEKNITEMLTRIDQEYRLLGDEKGNLSPQTKNLFYQYFKIANVIADKFENNNDEANTVAFGHAYKMLVLFGDDPSKFLSNVDKYLTQHNYNNISDAPLHDALMHPLPFADNKINLNNWRKLIQKNGPRAFKLFNLAPAIEKALGGRSPTNLEEAHDAARKLEYKRADENPLLAELFLNLNLSETLFDHTLEVDKGRKKRDNLPAANLHGVDINSKYADYHFIKLPIDDPTAYVLGNITNCCQHMGGHSEQCVIDGVTLENNGFYVLVKSKRKSSGLEKKSNANPLINGNINYEQFDIVGQGYAWLSQQGNLVFDSWENRNPDPDDKIIIPFLEKFAQNIVQQKDSTIMRVTIGTGGKTPDLLKCFYLKFAEQIKEGLQYGDSQSQSTIFCNEKLKESCDDALERKIDTLVKNINLNEQEKLELPKFKKWLTENCFSTAWVTIFLSVLTADNIKLLLTNGYRVYSYYLLNEVFNALLLLKQSGFEPNGLIFSLIMPPNRTPVKQIKEIISILSILKEDKSDLTVTLSDQQVPVKDIVNALLSTDMKEEKSLHNAITPNFNAIVRDLEIAAALVLLNKQNLDKDERIRSITLTSNQPLNAALFLIQWEAAKLEADIRIADNYCKNIANFNQVYVTQLIRCFSLLKEINPDKVYLIKKRLKLFNQADMPLLEKAILQLRDANLLDNIDIQAKIFDHPHVLYEKFTNDIVNAFILLREANLEQDIALRKKILAAPNYNAENDAKNIIPTFTLLKEANLDQDQYKAASIKILQYPPKSGEHYALAFVLLQKEQLTQDKELFSLVLNSDNPLSCAQSLVLLKDANLLNDVEICIKVLTRHIVTAYTKDIVNAFVLLREAKLETDVEIRQRVLNASNYCAVKRAKEIIAANKKSVAEIKPVFEDSSPMDRLLAIRSFIDKLELDISNYEVKTLGIFPAAGLTLKNKCLSSLMQLRSYIEIKPIDEIENQLLIILVKYHGDLVATTNINYLANLKSILNSMNIQLPDGLRIAADQKPNDVELFNSTLKEFRGKIHKYDVVMIKQLLGL